MRGSECRRLARVLRVLRRSRGQQRAAVLPRVLHQETQRVGGQGGQGAQELRPHGQVQQEL